MKKIIALMTLFSIAAQSQVQSASCTVCGPFINGEKKTCAATQEVRFKVNGYSGNLYVGPYKVSVWSISNEPTPRISLYSKIYNFEALGMFDGVSRKGTVLLKKGILDDSDTLQDIGSYTNAVAEASCDLK